MGEVMGVAVGVSGVRGVGLVVGSLGEGILGAVLIGVGVLGAVVMGVSCDGGTTMAASLLLSGCRDISRRCSCMNLSPSLIMVLVRRSRFESLRGDFTLGIESRFEDVMLVLVDNAEDDGSEVTEGVVGTGEDVGGGVVEGVMIIVTGEGVSEWLCKD